MPLGLSRQHRIPARPRPLPAGGRLHPLRGAAAAGPGAGRARGSTVRVVPNPLRREIVAEPRPLPRAAAAPRGGLDRPAGRSQELAGASWRSPASSPAAGSITSPGSSASRWRRTAPRACWRRRAARRSSRRLRWFGALPYGRIPLFLDAVRASGGAVVSTSRGESFGLTIAEAMARRCAVAAPDHSAFPEFVLPGKTGSLFTPGSADSAADRLQELLGDAALRREAGRRGAPRPSSRDTPPSPPSPCWPRSCAAWRSRDRDPRRVVSRLSDMGRVRCSVRV